MQYFSPFVQEETKEDNKLKIGFTSQFEDIQPIMHDFPELKIDLIKFNVQAEFTNLINLSKKMDPFPSNILDNYYLKEIQTKINKN
jgi:hypothetical protein